MSNPDIRRSGTARNSADFVVRHELWNDERHSAASAVERQLDSLDFVRLVFGDPHGVLRSKTLTTATFRSVLRNGMDFSPGPFVFDTGHAVAIDIFASGGGIGLDELTGAGDFLVVPDPTTFRVLPYTDHRTGWVIGDEYLRTGAPHPLSSRAALRRACERAATRDLEYVVGLEVEWYLTRYTDNGRPGALGGFGAPGIPAAVEPVNSGYQFNSDSLIDRLMPMLSPLVDVLLTLDLPLRTIEHESGPGQMEFTFNPQDGMAAADTMLLFRTVTKQVLARAGYHASFMALPRIAGFDPSGWHLHQSLAQRSTGTNLFVADSADAVLSDTGFAYLGGLLDNAADVMMLAVPTVNGFHRIQEQFVLAPDRIAWTVENRGAFLRVLGGYGDPATHVENRVGEPCANPYLYLASQLAAGLDGIDRKLDPGAPATDPHSASASQLPSSLGAALQSFRDSKLCRSLLGDAFTECLYLLKRSELTRYEQWLTDAKPVDEHQVTEWEHREYFGTY